MTTTAAPEPESEAGANWVAVYKGILRDVLDARPSGTRLRLATALGKNRSFVTQITNPAYPVPVPAQHIDTIFEICHLSPRERAAFLDAYGKAHPRRLPAPGVPDRRQRKLTVTVPDFGDAVRNAAFDAAVRQAIAALAGQERNEAGGPTPDEPAEDTP